MGYDVDPVTKSVVMTVTDFAEENELEESQLLWDQQVNDLRRVLGA
ncbi:MAG: START-like domain-containing protein [Flavobacteriales bacterium]